MNGLHDLGGMDGFGAIERETDEPVFHEQWEGRVFGNSWIAARGAESEAVSERQLQFARRVRGVGAAKERGCQRADKVFEIDAIEKIESVGAHFHRDRDLAHQCSLPDTNHAAA